MKLVLFMQNVFAICFRPYLFVGWLVFQQAYGHISAKVRMSVSPE